MLEDFWKIYKRALKLTEMFSMLRPSRGVRLVLTEVEETDMIFLPDIPEIFKGGTLFLNDSKDKYLEFENKLKQLETLIHSIKKL